MLKAITAVTPNTTTCSPPLNKNCCVPIKIVAKRRKAALRNGSFAGASRHTRTSSHPQTNPMPIPPTTNIFQEKRQGSKATKHPATLQPCNPSTLQPCNPATLQPYTSIANFRRHKRSHFQIGRAHNQRFRARIRQTNHITGPFPADQ